MTLCEEPGHYSKARDTASGTHQNRIWYVFGTTYYSAAIRSHDTSSLSLLPASQRSSILARNTLDMKIRPS